MGDSLKEQLLKAGFKAETRPRRKHPIRSGPKKTVSEEIDLARAYALRHQDEKAQARSRKQAKSRENALRKRQNDALEALLKDRGLNDKDADIPRHFMDGERITRIYVTANQRQDLADGRLAIVKLRRRYLLVDAGTGERAAAIKAEAVMDLSSEVDDNP